MEGVSGEVKGEDSEVMGGSADSPLVGSAMVTKWRYGERREERRGGEDDCPFVSYCTEQLKPLVTPEVGCV